MVEVRVRFASPAEASVKINHVEQQTNQLISKVFLETWLFSTFAFRNLRNAGNHPSKEALLSALDSWESLSLKGSAIPNEGERVLVVQRMPIYEIAIKMGIDQKTAESKYGNHLWIVSDSHQGKKEFIGRLDNPFTRPAFYMDVNGFGFSGFLGIALPMFSTNAVILFLGYLNIIHGGSKDYPTKLKRVASGCAEAFRLNKVSLLNQEKLGFEIVKSTGLI